MEATTYTQAELLEALRYALRIIDSTAALAKDRLESVPAASVDPETGLPDSAASAARMRHRSDLRAMAAHGPSNAAAIRAIVNGEAATAWFDPVADIRARLSAA